MFQNTQKFKKDLQERHKKIKSYLEKIATKTNHAKNDYEAKFPEYGRSEDENAEEVATFVDALSLEENLKNSLLRVESALAKIRKKKYGVCESCGKNITKKRLEVLPTAAHCLECENKNNAV